MFKLTLIKALRKLYEKVARPESTRWCWPDDGLVSMEAANEDIYNLLMSPEPCYIGRLGTTEGQILCNYLSVHAEKSLLLKCWDCIRSRASYPWWDEGLPFYNMATLSGFFAPTIGVCEIEHFCEECLKVLPEMDLCGRFSSYEVWVPFAPTCRFHQLETLYPFFVKNSWMRALKGKKVLVIHPFKKSIEQQYKRREKLFPNPDWLPEFGSLTVIQAVQSVAGNQTPYKDWFEALDSMKRQIDAADFDVAIIGCGAYGMPLAGYCKSIGKKALHLGGGTQLLFGIKGKRWEKQYKRSCYRDLFNEYWVYPDAAEKPATASRVEEACYW